MAHFYSHIIEIESIVMKLDEMELTNEQKIHLASLIDSTIHNHVLDLIFSQLSDEDKMVLVEKMKSGTKNKEIMDFLSQKVDNIEDQILKTVDSLKDELHEDIKEAKRSV